MKSFSFQIDRSQFKAIHGNTGFIPLPAEEHRRMEDNRCACPYCSVNGHMTECASGVWDTQAVSLATGETWLVHYPELHGLSRLRTDDDVILGRTK